MGSATIDALFEQGEREWPEIALERSAFDDYARERLGDSSRDSVSACDLFLACACSHGEPHALAIFDKTYLVHVPMFLAGLGSDAHFIDEVRQRVRERLFVDGKIRLYSGHGKLKSWLRVVTVRAALNARDKHKPSSETADALPSSAIDPELAVIQQRYGDEFNTALRETISRLPPEHRSLLRLHYVDGLNIAKIALVFGVSRATIGRRVLEVRERIFDDVVAALGDRLSATPAEVESLLRVVRSGLAISLSSVLGET